MHLFLFPNRKSERSLQLQCHTTDTIRKDLEEKKVQHSNELNVSYKIPVSGSSVLNECLLLIWKYGVSPNIITLMIVIDQTTKYYHTWDGLMQLRWFWLQNWTDAFSNKVNNAMICGLVQNVYSSSFCPWMENVSHRSVYYYLLKFSWFAFINRDRRLQNWHNGNISWS